MLEKVFDDKFVSFVPKVLVIGIGGAGVNAINNMILSGLSGARFVVANTDAQTLGYSLAEEKIQLGPNLTKGLGAGTRPDIGSAAAEESQAEVKKLLNGIDLLFIASGMGGGTGTGAAPIIAKIAKDLGILTVAVVTRPFDFEGPKRIEIASSGIEKLESCVDTLIVVSNNNLLRLADQNTGLSEAFKIADNVLLNVVRVAIKLLQETGFINRDFADLQSILSNMGRAMIGYGHASGDNRHIIALEEAIFNPILEEGASISGAKKILLNITGGKDLKIIEVDAIMRQLRSKVHNDANIIFGTVFDQDLEGSIYISIIATGMEKNENINLNEIKKEQLINEEVNQNITHIKIDSFNDLNQKKNYSYKEDEIEISSDNIDFSNIVSVNLVEKPRDKIASDFTRELSPNIKNNIEKKIAIDPKKDTLFSSMFSSILNTHKAEINLSSNEENDLNIPTIKRKNVA